MLPCLPLRKLSRDGGYGSMPRTTEATVRSSETPAPPVGDQEIGMLLLVLSDGGLASGTIPQHEADLRAQEPLMGAAPQCRGMLLCV